MIESNRLIISSTDKKQAKIRNERSSGTEEDI